MTKSEHFDFRRTKEIIERVFRRLGIKREYLAREWQRDEKFMRDSIWRKQVLRHQEAERIAMFETWQHGRQVVEIEAEAPEDGGFALRVSSLGSGNRSDENPLLEEFQVPDRGDFSISALFKPVLKDVMLGTEEGYGIK